MKRAFLAIIPALLLILSPCASRAGAAAEAVDLGVPHIIQETEFWGWAAAAQGLLMHRLGPARTPPQCALSSVCLGRTGGLEQIENILARFGFRYTRMRPRRTPRHYTGRGSPAGR